MGFEEKVFLVFLIGWVISALVIGCIIEKRHQLKSQKETNKALSRENELLRDRLRFIKNEVEVQKFYNEPEETVVSKPKTTK